MDLARTHASLSAEILQDFAELMETGAFVHGPAVARFEEAFAAETGVARCVGMSSGLDALRIALIAAGLERGEEVIVPAMTFVATLEAVDASRRRLRSSRTSRRQTSTSTPMPRLQRSRTARDSSSRSISTGNSLTCAGSGRSASRSSRTPARRRAPPGTGFAPGQAGSRRRSASTRRRTSAPWGTPERSSRTTTNLPTGRSPCASTGSGGSTSTTAEGYTARLDTMQAIVLLRKLPLLQRWNDERRAIATLYLEALEDVGDLRLPPVPAGSEPVWHLFVVRTAEPDLLAAHLAERGVQSGRHYPLPVHLTEAYAYLGLAEGSFPVAEALARQCLSLPIFPGMREDEVEHVVAAVKAFFDHG